MNDFDVSEISRQIISGEQRPSHCDAIYLISFNSSLLTIADEFDNSPVRVLTRHGTTFDKLAGFDKLVGNKEVRGPARSDETSWRFEQFVPRREAISVLLKALEGMGASSLQTSLRQTLIRQALVRFDPRWAGRGADTRTQGIIGLLIDCAIEDGLIEVDRSGNDPNNPRIWIKTTERISPLSSRNGTVDVAQSGSEMKLADAAEMATQSVREDRPLSEEENIFREIKWGPFATERWLMYQAIEETVVGLKGTPIPVNQLIDAAKKIVSKKLQNEVVSVKDDGILRRRPWPAIVTMFNTLLPRSDALIGVNDERIKPGIDAPLKEVYGLDVDFSIKVDAVLVEAYLEKVKSIPQSKIFDLAGALYFERTTETHSRVIQVLKVLQARGRVEYVMLEDGTESIRLVPRNQVLAFPPKPEIGIADVTAVAN